VGEEPIQVLHVVRAVPGGGVETWLPKVMSQMDRDRVRFDFCALWPPSAAFEDEIQALGGRVLTCLFSRHLPTFGLRFRRLLGRNSYDVVHSHVGWPSGLVLRQAHRSGVPGRIVHCHNSDDLNPRSLPWNAWRAAMRAMIRKYATVGLACSVKAAEFTLGPQWNSDPRFRVLHCGINLEPFRSGSSPGEVRMEFGIPADAPVVGHVGQFVERKNHAFLLEIAREVLRRRPEVRFLMVGEGPLRPRIESLARGFGIEKNVVFAGERRDIPRMMLNAMDVLAFPSLEEGLPIVLTEAQAAGLRSLTSSAVTSEGDLLPGAVEHLPLSKSAACWATRLLDMMDRGPVRKETALHTLEQSDFNIRQSCRVLTGIYELCAGKRSKVTAGSQAV
jgi:glycosyltransferase involved in cell wall biosynthesis